MFYNTNVREFTCKLLDAVDEGMINPRDALAYALSYMSEADVKDMCQVNEFFPDEDEDDPMDDFNYVGSKHHY